MTIRDRRLPLQILAIALAAAIGVVAHAATAQAPAAPAKPAPPRLALTFGPQVRLLVIAPHPDDEALGAAGLIQRIVATGGSVRVVLVTSGDAFSDGVKKITRRQRLSDADFRAYGIVREKETIAAMERLGVSRRRLRFLGFPDGELCFIAAQSKNRALVSPYTGRSSPPRPEQLFRSAQYRALDIRREIERELIEFQPTVIAMPHGDDQHPDHCSTYLYARDALRAPRVRHRVHARVLLYLVHHPQWPFETAPDPATPLAPPADTAQREHWVTLPLTPDESAKKVDALRKYYSQQMVIGKFVEQFYRPNELFVDGPPATPATCWCDDRTVVHEVVPGRDHHTPR